MGRHKDESRSHTPLSSRKASRGRQSRKRRDHIIHATILLTCAGSVLVTLFGRPDLLKSIGFSSPFHGGAGQSTEAAAPQSAPIGDVSVSVPGAQQVTGPVQGSAAENTSANGAQENPTRQETLPVVPTGAGQVYGIETATNAGIGARLSLENGNAEAETGHGDKGSGASGPIGATGNPGDGVSTIDGTQRALTPVNGGSSSAYDTNPAQPETAPFTGTEPEPGSRFDEGNANTGSTFSSGHGGGAEDGAHYSSSSGAQGGGAETVYSITDSGTLENAEIEGGAVQEAGGVAENPMTEGSIGGQPTEEDDNKFRGVQMNPVDNKNVTWISYMFFRIIVTTSITQVAELACAQSKPWMPATLTAIETEMLGFGYQCWEPSQAVAEEMQLFYKDTPSASVQTVRPWSELLPKVDMVFSMGYLSELEPTRAWKVFKNIKNSGVKWVLFENHIGARNVKPIPGRGGVMNVRKAPFHFDPPQRVVSNISAEEDGLRAQLVFYEVKLLRKGI